MHIVAHCNVHIIGHIKLTQKVTSVICVRIDKIYFFLLTIKAAHLNSENPPLVAQPPRRGISHSNRPEVDLHWLRIEERIVYKLLILTFKAFIDRIAPLYLCELIEQQKSSTNTRTRLANDAFLLKLPPPSRNFSDTFFDRSFTYGAPYEWNKLDERVRRLSNFNLFKSEIKTVLFLRYFNS